MKVLHINQSDIAGGAAIASYRIHEALLGADIDSNMLVGFPRTNGPRIAKLPRRRAAEAVLSRVLPAFGFNDLHSIGSFKIPEHPFFDRLDVLHLHNLHSGYFSLLSLPRVAKTIPVVYTLHDMWGFTGHCAYSFDCDRWQTGCGSCPYPMSYPAVTRDNTRLEWKLKNWIYQRVQMSVVTPSKWLADLASKSMLKEAPVSHIPHGLDLNVYKPRDRSASRRALEISENKRVILFGAQDLDDPRKGGALLMKALQALPDTLRREMLLLELGNGGDSIAKMLDVPTLSLGYIDSDLVKSIAYSCADLLVFPTRADNSPLVLVEALACGTPMISFAVGGVPEIVRHGVTGYLARPEDVTDFRNAIVQLLEADNVRKQMSAECRRIAIEEYSLERMSDSYTKLYRHCIQAGS